MPKFAMRDPNTGTMVPLLGGVDEATADATFLPKTGGTTGFITAPAPTQPNHAATKYYADHWFPVGAISGFSGNYVPQGWLHCNGQAISRTYYSELWAVCSTRFGGGDGSTTFNLPDCRDRAVISMYTGYGGMDYIGAVGGVTDVQIQRTHMPGASGQFNFHGAGSRTSLANAYGSGATWLATGMSYYGNPQYPQTGASSIGIANIVYGGGGGYHTNVQPSLTMHFMIKY